MNDDLSKATFILEKFVANPQQIIHSLIPKWNTRPDPSMDKKKLPHSKEGLSPRETGNAERTLPIAGRQTALQPAPHSR